MVHLNSKTTYYGGKGGAGVAQFIINQIPPHNCYIEMFLGKGTIMRYIKPADKTIGIEISKRIIDFYKDTLPYDAVIYNCNALTWIKKNVPQLVLVDKNVYAGRPAVAYKNIYEDHTAGVDKNVYNYRQTDLVDNFIYADPPYMMNTRRSNKKIYDNEMTEKDHINFLNIMLRLNASIAISHYKCQLYDEMLSGWRKLPYKVQTRKGSTTEYLYCNYPVPGSLHDYRYLGKDRTDRQRIFRKVKGHIDKLNELPLYERQAIMEGINGGDIVKTKLSTLDR